jgi:hypothetical protein
MNSRNLTRLFAAAMLTVPTVSQALVFNITSPEAIYSGLGVCGTGPLAGACDIPQLVPPGIGTVDNGAPTWGLGLPYDMLRLQAFNITVDTAVPATFAGLKQVFDFAVGDTGGGSAGPCVPGPFPICGPGVDYALTFGGRTISVNGGAPQTLTQTGNLNINWLADTVTINPVSIDLGGGVILNIGGGSLTASGDPEGILDIQVIVPTAVPEPSTLALFGLALAGFAARRRRSI